MTSSVGSDFRVNAPGAALSPAPPETSSSVIVPASADVVAFVGRTLKGPLNEPVLVSNFSRFQQQFGGLWAGSLLPHAVEQFFEHGGRRALIVRVASGARAPSIDLPAGGERLTLVGLSPGSGEFLRVSVDHDGIGNQDQDLFNLVVQRVRTRGSELVEEQEIFRRISILSGSARDVARKLATSKLVRVAGALPSRRPDVTRGRDPGSLIGYVECNDDGDDGQPLSDYDLIGSETRHTGLFALPGGFSFSFLYLPPPARGQDLGFSALLVAARFCRRHQALLLVDPPARWDSVARVHEALDEWPFRSADALMFFPRLMINDPLLGRAAEFPPSAAVIGALLRDEEMAWWDEAAEPASLRPSATPAAWIEAPHRARLAQRGVNALRTARGKGRERVPVCTLAGELGNGPEFRLLSARRLALQLGASIERGTSWVRIEGNTARSRERVCRQVEQFLKAYADAGAFAGVERNRHYFVLCDERLNPPASLEAGVFRMVYGYQSCHASLRQNWLVEHGPHGSRTRAASLNQLAALELQVG